ncbi:MAG: class I SAM-dependent methyltransferase [Burkholderiales bacterium]|nr:class I SAM-dependent methyltransferase [Burkholderiales bacterium]
MDTFRYFEFDFFWRTINKSVSIGDYLDVSSPRLFNWRVLTSEKTRSAVLLNPDGKDLAATAQLLEAAGLRKFCELRCVLVSELFEPPASFDTVACISVLEHIPQEAAMAALQTMWELLRSGGRLLLSVPCARKGFEEYTDFNEYGLLTTGSDGFVFGQRFYDREMVEECIYSIVGKPVRSAYFGEKVAGTFASNRERQLSDASYPFWRESWTMARQYRYFENTDSMPGLGVVAFEFVKP